MNEQLLNPALNQEALVKQIIFFGGKLNGWIVGWISKFGFDTTQSSVLLALVYVTLLYLILTLLSSLKKPVKIVIIALIVYLIIGFFG